jgi:hypothetical protein
VPALDSVDTIPGPPITEQVYTSNDMVGAIIGKSGVKINEIRQLSGSQIKIIDPQDNETGWLNGSPIKINWPQDNANTIVGSVFAVSYLSPTTCTPLR